MGIDDDLQTVLAGIADSSQAGTAPPLGDELGQVLLWGDGRAVTTPPMTADLATLLLSGAPATFESGLSAGPLEKPWERVQKATGHGLFASGLYQLGSHPISRFNGVALPPGSRIRFADASRLLKGQMETRLVTVLRPGTKNYYAWDAHLPVGNQPHAYWHVNQGGMHGLFGQSNHSPLTPAQITQAKGLRYIRVGGRVLWVIGVVVDAAYLVNSIDQSIEAGSPNPAIAQAIRTVGGWGGGWAGAKIGCAAGAAAGVETGPGLVLTCIAGSIIGGFAGYYGADWIADMISED